MEATAALLRQHEALPNPQEKTHVMLAYDRLGLPVLAENVSACMISGDEAGLNDALHAVRNQLGRNEDAFKVQEAGLLSHLSACAVSSPSVRTHTTALECLRMVLSTPTNRSATISEPAVLEALASSCSTAQPAGIRAEAYGAYAAAAEAVEAATIMTDRSVVALLVERLSDELSQYTRQRMTTDGVLAALKRTLSCTPSGAAAVALQQGAVRYLLEALNLPHVAPSTLTAALGCLTDLAFDPAAKAAILQQPDAMPRLMALCGHPEPPVRAGAAGCIMQLSNDDDGKRAVIDCGGPGPLVALLRTSHTLSQLFSCRALASLAAHPRLRAALLPAAGTPAVSLLQGLAGESSSAAASVRSAAATALAVITWTP